MPLYQAMTFHCQVGMPSSWSKLGANYEKFQGVEKSGGENLEVLTKKKARIRSFRDNTLNSKKIKVNLKDRCMTSEQKTHYF